MISCHSQSPSESRDNALGNWIDPLDTPSKHMINATWARLTSHWASLVAQMVKCLPAMQKTWVRSLGQEDPLEEGMAAHSSIFAWRIPWTEKPGEQPSRGPQRVRHNLTTKQKQLWKTSQTPTAKGLLCCCPQPLGAERKRIILRNYLKIQTRQTQIKPWLHRLMSQGFKI